MEDYREKQKTGQVISDAVPLQQRLPNTDVVDAEGGDSPQTPDESSSGESEYEDDKGPEHLLDMDVSPVITGVGAESSFLGLDKSSKEGEIEFQKKDGDDEGDQQAQKIDETKSMMAM